MACRTLKAEQLHFVCKLKADRVAIHHRISMAKRRARESGAGSLQCVFMMCVVLAFLALQWLRVQDTVVQSFIVSQASGPLVNTGELSQGFLLESQSSLWQALQEHFSMNHTTAASTAATTAGVA